MSSRRPSQWSPAYRWSGQGLVQPLRDQVQDVGRLAPATQAVDQLAELHRARTRVHPPQLGQHPAARVDSTHTHTRINAHARTRGDKKVGDRKMERREDDGGEEEQRGGMS